MTAGTRAESAKAGARRLFQREIADGFEPVALHCYADADGQPLFYRPRLRHPDGRKVIKPMRLDGLRHVMGEPALPASGKPLYVLPELLAADADAVAWIVEGESCADALRALGVLATTSGSATSDSAADWQSLAGRHCVLWPDNDGAGATYGANVAERLRAIGCVVELVDLEPLALPPAGDCVDWLARNPEATPADLLRLARVALDDARDADGERPAPEPLRRPVPPPEPYPVAELGPILAPACESLRRVIQAPDAICGAALLAAASLSVQGMADVSNSGRTHPLSLWFLSVAESGERKSAVDSEAMRPAREYEKGLAQAYEAEAELHDAQMEEWEARRTDAKKKAKGGNGLADALRAIGPAPPPPLRPIVIAADFTAEGLAKLLAVGLPSMAAFTDEAALVFGGHGMNKEAAARTAGTLCKLWDNGALDRIRAGEGPVKLWGRRLAVHLMGQPVIAERALSDELLAGQGFLARCLLSWPRSTAGTRHLSLENLANDPALIRYRARAADLLAQPLPMAEGARNELEPRLLPLSPDAARGWEELHNAVEAAMAPGQRYASSSVKAWASKAPEQCLRIAGVLTLFENEHAAAIDAETLDRAAELALWHLGEAARLAGTAEMSPEVRDAEALLAWAHENGHECVYSTMALQKGPARIREVGSFKLAMGELERAGWADPIDGGMSLDGRQRRHVWRVWPNEGGAH